MDAGTQRPPVRHRGFLDRDTEELFYEVVTPDGAGGDGDRWVVLTHGLGGNHAVWFQQVPVLAAAGWSVLVWDQRGFGLSTDRGGRASVRVAGGDLLAVCDAVGVERAWFVGQSMGGWTTTHAVAADASRAVGVVFADTLGGWAHPGWAERVRSLGARDTGPGRLGVHPALGEALGRTDPARAYLYQLLGGLGRSGGPPAHVAVSLATETVDDPVLAGLGVPVLFVVGAEDPIFPPAWVRDAAALVPDAEVAVIDGAGHSPYFETPEAWNAAVLGFMSRRS